MGTSLGIVGQRPSKDPQTKQAIVIVLGCFPELERKDLLLSTHALWTEEVEEASSLNAGSHSVGRRCARCPGREAVSSPACCNAHKAQWLWQVIPTVEQWHFTLG